MEGWGSGPFQCRCIIVWITSLVAILRSIYKEKFKGFSTKGRSLWRFEVKGEIAMWVLSIKEFKGFSLGESSSLFIAGGIFLFSLSSAFVVPVVLAHRVPIKF